MPTKTIIAVLVMGLVLLGHHLGSQAFGMILAAAHADGPPEPRTFAEIIVLCVVTSQVWATAVVLGMPFIGTAIRILNKER